MFFSRPKNLIGLDIGSSAVKVVELKDLGKGKGYQLLNVALERLSPEAIVDGAIMDAGLVVENVKRAYQVLKVASGGEGNMDVLLVAAKKDKINDYTSVFGQAGRNPLLVDVDVFALQNCYEMNYDT